jgi:FtsH-binding integral membrane protein
MSRQAFLGLVNLFTAAGVLFAFAVGSISYDWNLDSWGTWPKVGFFLGILVVALIGTAMYISSDRPLVSLLGYALVAGPFGLMCGPYVAQYTPESALRMGAVTVIMTVLLGMVGIMIPDRLDGLFLTILTVGLIALIVGYFIVPLLALFGVDAQGPLTMLDWVGVAIFSGFIVYDLNKAKRGPFTLDRAIDCAAMLFTDIVNLFLHVLGLGGDRD